MTVLQYVYGITQCLPSSVAALQFVSLTDAAISLPMEDDIASEQIVSPQGIPVFGQNHTNLFVSTNSLYMCCFHIVYRLVVL